MKFLINDWKILLISWTIVIATSFLWILFSNLIINPVESYINNWYYNDAKKTLARTSNLIVIGITGSYGKTSTKHFLHRLLSEKYNVLMTPGSYNTTMGVVRTIRENLKPTHEVFIVEMGAKQIGDIKEICDLVKPKFGVLTAVGEQHLETFMTVENVKKTKFELVDALPKDGLGVLNADFPLIKNRPISNTSFVYYGIKDTDSFYTVKDIQYSPEGVQFYFCENDKKLIHVKTKILGDHNISNLLASIGLAKSLGVKETDIKFAVSKIRPVKHRLEVKKGLNNITIIDDAFNSNPLGAKMALDVMGMMQGDGKKIIVTPGMIELGKQQEKYNQNFGEQISEICDFVILVGKKQTKPIFLGLQSRNFPITQIFIAKDLNEAVNKLQMITKSGDIVLYENDLPDTFN